MTDTVAATSGTCCPLVWAVTMPHGGMAAQPMQMFMYAPMQAPVMMPTLDAMVGYGNSMANLTSPSYAWPAEGAWPYFGEASVGEQAPQQLPMFAGAPQAMPAQEACAQWQFVAQGDVPCCDVPTQLQMPAAQITDQVQMNANVGAGTLRRRRVQDCRGAAPDIDNAEASPEEETELEAVQAREIASRLLEQLQAGGDVQRAAVASFERLAFTSKLSSRAAQIVLEEASMANAAAIASGLRGHVRSAVQSKHANYVVQKITEVMPVAHAGFVVDELKGFGQDAARHCFGCRVLCRILEHLSAADASTIELVEELLAGLDELCSHSFGSFVVRHLLEFGLPGHRHQVAIALRKDLVGYAKHKFGSHVVEAALRHSGPEDQQLLARELLANKEQLIALAGNQFGRHVVRALLGMPGGLKAEAVEALQHRQAELKASRFGKSVLQALRAAMAD